MPEGIHQEGGGGIGLGKWGGGEIGGGKWRVGCDEWN